MNSVNSRKLINHWSVIWAQFKDPHCYLCLPGSVVACWFITQAVGVRIHFFCKNNFYRFCRFFRIHLGKTWLGRSDRGVLAFKICLCRTRIASWCFQFLWDIHEIIVKLPDFELKHTRLCCINIPLTRYRDQAGIPSNAALIWDSIYMGFQILHRRGNQSMKGVTIHHLNQDAPTSSILLLIAKGLFTTWDLLRDCDYH